MHVMRPLAIGLSLLAALAAAQDEEDEAVAALTRADDAEFARLAARDEPDPWLIATRLAAAGHGDRARRFAEAKPRPAVRGLAEFLAAKPTFDEQVRAVRDRALVRLEDDRATKEQLDADRRAIEGVLDRANPFERAQLVAIRGFLRVYLGDVRAGQEDLLASARAARDLGWLRGAADALGTASENARVLYDPAEAVRLAREELALRWELGDRDTTLLHLRRLVEVMSEIGDGEAALAELARWTARLGEPVELDRASLLLRLADPGPALAVAGKFGSGRAHLLAGDAQRQLGREAEALASYRRAAERFLEADDRVRRGHALGNAGLSLLRLGRPADARALLEEAQRHFDDAKDRGLAALAVLHRGDAHLAAREAPAALRLFEAVRAFAVRTGDAWLEGQALVRRGRAQLAMREAAEARKSFTAARRIGDELSFAEIAAAASLGQARCYLHLGRPKLAAAAAGQGREALAPLIDDRPVPPGDEARRLHAALGDAAVEAALALDSDTDLWRALERRALGLPRTTRTQVAGIRARAMTEAQREEIAARRRDVTRYALWEDRARQEEDRARAVKFRAQRDEAERRLRAGIETVQRHGRPGWELLYPRPVALASARLELAADETLVHVAEADGRAVALLVSRAEVRRVPVERGAALETRTARVTIVGPTLDLRGSAADRLRALSATEALLLRRRAPKGEAVVLERPPTPEVLRARFLDGALRLLAPRVPVPAARVEAMRAKLASGEAIRLPRTSRWDWWGVGPDRR